MNELKIKLAGLTCEACVKIATKRIKGVAGVEDVTIDLPTGDTVVKSCHQLAVEDIETGLADTHYTIVK